MNTIVSVAWGIVLSELTGQRDVVFGTAISWRPAEVPGSDSAVGLYVNTVPIRLRYHPSDPLIDLLVAFQREQVALMPHRTLGLGDIQKGLGGADLFDTFLVFASEAARPEANIQTPHGLRARVVEITDNTHYPLSVLASANDPLQLQLTYRPDLLDPSTLARVERHLSYALARISACLTTTRRSGTSSACEHRPLPAIER